MQRFIKLVLLVCCFVFSKQNFSQDIMAGHIDYKWISAYTYSITLTLITDTNVNVNRPSVSLYGTSGSFTLNSSFNSGKTKIRKYSGLTTFSSTGYYVIAYLDSFRVANIENIPNSQSKTFYIESAIDINAFRGPNTSPVITNYPENFNLSSSSASYNPGFYDADGDSLTYQLIYCWGSTSVGYHIPTGTIIDNLGTLDFPKDSTGIYSFSLHINELRSDGLGGHDQVGYSQIDFALNNYNSIGIKELDKKEIISIYPNPTSNILNIKTNSKTNSEIEITNQLGQTVLKQKYSENIDVSKLVPGCYFIRVDNSYSKFIKE